MVHVLNLANEQHGHFRPATVQQDAEQLRVELERALESEVYAAAWQQGQATASNFVIAWMAVWLWFASVKFSVCFSQLNWGLLVLSNFNLRLSTLLASQFKSRPRRQQMVQTLILQNNPGNQLPITPGVALARNERSIPILNDMNLAAAVDMWATGNYAVIHIATSHFLPR